MKKYIYYKNILYSYFNYILLYLFCSSKNKKNNCTKVWIISDNNEWQTCFVQTSCLF